MPLINRMKIYRVFILSVVFLLAGCSTRVSVESTTTTKPKIEAPPQNIILMVGDGMGITQISAGIQSQDEALNLERFKVIGLSKTSSSEEVITDSAAGANAFSIGEKTSNGAIGIDQQKRPKETILEMLGSEGYSTGLIATCNITHATPACFYAHQEQRRMYYEIAADMVNAPVTLFIGGGKMHFENRTDEKEGQPDDRNIINELGEKGFSFVNSLEELEASSGKVGYFLSDDHPESILNGRSDILPKSIKPSISHLKKESDKGFFLMIEGAQIDWGGHANEGDYIVSEMLDFDKAVGEVLDFAEKDGNTLVVITADHETGGFALGSPSRDYTKTEFQFTTLGHTSVMVPVFAYGPGANLFGGVYENNTIYSKMLQALGR